jgi:hypothetical protein
MSNKSTNPSEKNRNHPVLTFALSTFMLVVAITWFIRGEIILPNKGVFLFGTHARSLATVVFLFAIWPLVRHLWNANKRLK